MDFFFFSFFFGYIEKIMGILLCLLMVTDGILSALLYTVVVALLTPALLYAPVYTLDMSRIVCAPIAKFHSKRNKNKKCVKRKTNEITPC